jgi:hypothetical protein
MAFDFTILLGMALYILIPPFLYSLPSKKCYAQFGLISFMVSSNTALYSIVLINTSFSLSSAFKNVFGLVGVWIAPWYWKILLYIAIYVLILLNFWISACYEIVGSVRKWQGHRYCSVPQCIALSWLIPGFLVPAASEIFGLSSVLLIYR